MNIQDILPKIEGEIDICKVNKKITDLAKSIDSLAAALIEIRDAFQNANMNFAEFYSKFYTANMPISLSSAMAVYISKKLNESPASDVMGLPQKVSSIIEAGKLDPSIVELFFTYLQFDDDSKKLPMADIASRIEKFDFSMKRLKRFFDRKTPVHVYKGLMTTRDMVHNKNWDAMIEDLAKKIATTTREPGQEDRVYELKKSMIQCRIIQRYEQQEKINLTYLLRILDKTCNVLNLDRSVELFNNLRAVNLPPNIAHTMGEYFTERANSLLLKQSDIESLVALINSKLESQAYSPHNVELFFLAASRKPECRNISMSEIPARLDGFDCAVKEINSFVKSHPEYNDCVTERNRDYRGSWSRMINFLNSQIADESKKPEKSDEVVKQLETKVTACKALVEMEEKQCLYPVSKRLYRP